MGSLLLQLWATPGCSHGRVCLPVVLTAKHFQPWRPLCVGQGALDLRAPEPSQQRLLPWASPVWWAGPSWGPVKGETAHSCALREECSSQSFPHVGQRLLGLDVLENHHGGGLWSLLVSLASAAGPQTVPSLLESMGLVGGVQVCHLEVPCRGQTPRAGMVRGGAAPMPWTPACCDLGELLQLRPSGPTAFTVQPQTF